MKNNIFLIINYLADYNYQILSIMLISNIFCIVKIFGIIFIYLQLIVLQNIIHFKTSFLRHSTFFFSCIYRKLKNYIIYI